MSNPDLATVENRLQALENRVAKNAAKAKSRATLTVVVMACLLVGVFLSIYPKLALYTYWKLDPYEDCSQKTSRRGCMLCQPRKIQTLM